MTNNENVILSAKDVVVEFDVRDRILTAIRSVSLDLVEGEVLAIVGESGSGKSVLTKTFTGMLEENGRVASGSIFYRGQELTTIKNHEEWEKIRGSKIATIFQDPMTSLNPLVTIGRQISEVIMKHQGKSASEAKEMAINYMERVGIPEAKKRFKKYPPQFALKYLACGWWTTSASVDCSGWSCNSSDSSTPMREGSSSRTRHRWRAKSA